MVTAVKDNQPTMFDDPQAIDWRGARRVDGGWEKAHGRLERRSCAVLDIGGARPAAGVPHRTSPTYGLTSLGAGQAGPEER